MVPTCVTFPRSGGGGFTLKIPPHLAIIPFQDRRLLLLAYVVLAYDDKPHGEWFSGGRRASSRNRVLASLTRFHLN